MNLRKMFQLGHANYGPSHPLVKGLMYPFRLRRSTASARQAVSARSIFQEENEMEPRKPKLPTEAVQLYNEFIHGHISRRDFFEGAKKFAVGGLAAGTIIDKIGRAHV